MLKLSPAVEQRRIRQRRARERERDDAVLIQFATQRTALRDLLLASGDLKSFHEDDKQALAEATKRLVERLSIGTVKPG